MKIPILVILYGILWFSLMLMLLSRKDLDPVTKLMWVIVVGFIPVAGTVLYLLAGPERVVEESGVTDSPADNLKGTPWEKNAG